MKTRNNYVALGTGLLALASIVFGAAGPEGLKTPAESTGYREYSQYEAIAAFLSRAEALAPDLEIRTVGRTQAVEEMASRDLFLCILAEGGARKPEDLDRTKPTVLIVASQHGNEQSAKEAALRIIRDLALGELRPLLGKINVLVIPQANPYGNSFDMRPNETGLDMNRDHVKLEAAGVEVIHRVFRAWMPEATMDVHEKGDDYYRVNIGCVSNAAIHPSIQEYSRRVILADVESRLRKENLTFHEYLVSDEFGLNTAAGAALPAEAPGRRREYLRYSTTDLNDGRNSLGIYETFSFIQEGASRHDLETLQDRMRWQTLGIRFFLESVAAHGRDITAMVGKSRAELTEKARSYGDSDLVPLRMEYFRDQDAPELRIQKFERAESPIRGVLTVDKKAGEAVTMGEIRPYPWPARLRVISEIVKDWFPDVRTTISVPRPLGYIIPASRSEVVDTLLRHDIRVDVFTEDADLEAESYRILDILPAGTDYLAPEKIEVDKRTTGILVKRGDFYVSCDQPAANLIPCLLEPQSEYGFIRYWKYGLVPEKGDFWSFHRLVKEPAASRVPYRGWSRAD